MTKDKYQMTRIMLVDDHEDIGRMLELILGLYQKKRGGGANDFAFVMTAPEAVQRVRNGERFDLILMDYQLPPGANCGVWATREIKKLAPDIPIVFLSAYTSRYNVDKAKEAGALAYTSKTIFSQSEIAYSLLEQDWEALQAVADNQTVWFFSS